MEMNHRDIYNKNVKFKDEVYPFDTGDSLHGGNDLVRIELNLNTLARIINGSNLCVAELRCLDTYSKQRLWRVCLDACTKPGC